MVEHNGPIYISAESISAELEESLEVARQKTHRAAEAIRRAQRGVVAGTMSVESVQRAENVWGRTESPWQILLREYKAGNLLI